MNRIKQVLLFLFHVILLGCANTGTGINGTILSLQDAIEQSADNIAEELPPNSRIAIVAFASENNNLSDYIMEELAGALLDLGIEVADRQNLEYVYKELNFQMSGNVSDETAKSIGKFLGADIVITGALTDLDSIYRYRISAIHVETAIRTSIIRLDVYADISMRQTVATLANQQSSTETASYKMNENSIPETAGTCLDRGLVFARQGEYLKAYEDFSEAIRLNPNMGIAYMHRGKTFYHIASEYTEEGRIQNEFMQAYDRAISDFDTAIRLNLNFIEAYQYRGHAYYEKKDYNKAITDFTHVIRLDPSAPSYYSRGLLYHKLRDFDRAIADFSQVIRINPHYAEAYAGRGSAYNSKRDFDRALSDLNQAIRFNPNNIEAYLHRGNVYGNKGDFNRAIADWETVLRFEPNHSDAKRFIEIARQMRGR